MKKQVLYITNNQLVIHAWQDGVVVNTLRLKHDENGGKTVQQIFEKNREVETYLLIDIVEEEYFNGVLPKVSFFDRKNFLQRQLNNHFRESNYRYAEYQGLDEDNKEKAFFASITNTQLIDPWIKILVDLKVSLVGIYSFPLTAYLLYSEICKNPEYALLITKQEGGIRYTFYNNNRLKMSRILFIHENDNAKLATIILQETEKTIRYLERIGLLPAMQNIAVFIINSHEFMNEFQHITKSDSMLDYFLLSPEQIAQTQNARNLQNNQNIDWIVAHILCQKSITNHYGLKEQLRFSRYRRSRKPAKAIGLAALAASLAWSSFTWYQAIELNKKSELLTFKIDDNRKQFHQIKMQFPSSPVSPQDLEQGLNTITSIKNSAPDSQLILQNVSNVIGKYEEINIKRFSITLEKREIKFEQQNTNTSVTLDPTLIPDKPKNRQRKLTVPVAQLVGEIIPFDGNYRKATQLIQRMVKDLQQNQLVYQAKAIRLPIDERMDKALVGEIGFKQGQSNNAYFEIEAMIKMDSWHG